MQNWFVHDGKAVEEVEEVVALCLLSVLVQDSVHFFSSCAGITECNCVVSDFVAIIFDIHTNKL